MVRGTMLAGALGVLAWLVFAGNAWAASDAGGSAAAGDSSAAQPDRGLHEGSLLKFLPPERRVALVIGNSAYQTAPLRNPANDARDMAAALRDLGFEVIEHIDADQRVMKRAIWSFGERLRQADVGLFYYAGHGVQIGGENYMIPVGARIEMEPDVEVEGVRVTRVMAEMDKANNGLNIVILDACRNNPFARSFRSAERGLARMNAPVGTIVAFATKPGDVAADGAGDNGVYTAELLQAMRTPGLKVEDVFKRTRAGVRRETDGRQIPWEETSLEGDFYFLPAGTGESPATPATSGDDPASGTDETVYWESVRGSDDPAELRAYLERYPGGAFTELAGLRIEALESEAAAAESREQTAVLTGAAGPVPKIEALDASFAVLRTSNLRAGPSTATAVVGKLYSGQDVLVTGKVIGTNWYRVAPAPGGTAFIHGDLVAPVDAEELATWTLARESGARTDYELYLAIYPAGKFASNARERIPLTAPVDAAPIASGEPSQAEIQVAVAPLPPGYQRGVSFNDCPGCPEMVPVAAGGLRMGSPPGEPGRANNEGPFHEVAIGKAFAIGKYEVTAGQWIQCIEEGGCEHKPKDVGKGGDDRAVAGVSWFDANQFIAWLSEKSGRPYRLPSEAEWEYAARAGSSTSYWWGGDVGRNNANCGLCGSRWDRRKVAPVGSFRSNAFGIHDLAGNVWEWVDDCWHDSYAGAPADGRAWLSGDHCSERVMRGGSWRDDPRHLRSAARSRYNVGSRFDFLGLRVVRPLEP